MCPASIHVQHLEARYTVARGLTDTAAVQHRLDRIAAEPLARRLEQLFTTLPDQDRALYFIEQMNVACTLDLNTEDDQLAGAWAEALHEDVLRTLRRGGSNLVRFADRGEYLASFLEDLLRGRAWMRWYYDEFAHLRTHTIGQAISHALVADADAGRDALLALARRGALDLLLLALDDAECEIVVGQCLLPAGGRKMPQMYEAWTQALRTQVRGLSLTSVWARDVARLYLSLLCDRPELGPDVNLAYFIRDLLQLRQAMMTMDGQHTLRSLFETEQWPAEWADQNLSHERELLTSLVRELGGTEVAGLLRDLQADGAQSVARRVLTNYGGIFLLAATIAEMGLEDFLRGCPYPEPARLTKGELLRYLIGLQCLGASNAQRARTDAGLLLFAGLSAAPDAHMLAEYAAALTPEVNVAFVLAFQSYRRANVVRFAVGPQAQSTPERAAEDIKWCSLWTGDGESLLPAREFDAALSEVSAALLRGFAAKLGAFAESSPAYLSRNFLECPAEVMVMGESLIVRFLSCPLQMVLRMAGFDHRRWVITWLEDGELEVHFD